VEDPQDTQPSGWALFVSDVRRVSRAWKTAAKVAAVLALACHFLPPHYRVVCDGLASVCTGGH
jgi:hypothetical protein